MAPEELFFRLSEARDSWHVSIYCFSLDLEMLLCPGTVFRFCNVLCYNPDQLIRISELRIRILLFSFLFKMQNYFLFITVLQFLLISYRRYIYIKLLVHR
jgi:hypothetical protein